MSSLYEIDFELDLWLTEAMSEAELNEGVIPDIIADRLDRIRQKQTVKRGNVCKYIKSLRAESDSIAIKEKKFRARQKVIKNKLAWLTGALKLSLKVGEKFNDGVSKVSWDRSCQTIPTNMDIIPDDYMSYEPKFDKASAKEDIENGVDVPGVELKYSNNVRIK